MLRRTIVLSAALILLTLGGSTAPAGETAAAPKSGKPAAGDDSMELDRLLAEEVLSALPAGRGLAPRASDEVFLRRAHLDLVGGIPTSDEVKRFTADKSPAKRSALITALLSDSRFGVNAAHYWRDVIVARAVTAGEGPLVHFDPTEAWFARQFNDNVGWDKSVRALIEAKGPFRDHGEAALFLAQRFSPVGVAGEASRIFLGIQIQCAECHDHPTDRWKRRQFHEFAAFFPRVGLAPFERAKGARREAQVASFDAAPQVRPMNMRYAGVPEYFMPDPSDPTSQGALIAPGFFVTEKKLKSGATDAERRKSLAEWLTARDNPWFAKAFVNRIWAELVGEGFYEPVDDIGPDRACSAPRTLEYLSTRFADRGYDVKWLYLTIMETAAYQRESRKRRGADEPPFMANVPQPLRSDQLSSVLSQVVGFDVAGALPAEKGRPTGAAQLRTLFGFDPSSRREEVAPSIPQALMLMNSEALGRAVKAQSDDSMLSKLLSTSPTDESAVVDLYLRCLAREPNERERKICLEHIGAVGDRAAAFEDLFWSLLNSEELRTRY